MLDILRSSKVGIAICTTFVALAFLLELIVHGMGCLSLTQCVDPHFAKKRNTSSRTVAYYV